MLVREREKRAARRGAADTRAHSPTPPPPQPPLRLPLPSPHPPPTININQQQARLLFVSLGASTLLASVSVPGINDFVFYLIGMVSVLVRGSVSVRCIPLTRCLVIISA